MHLQSDIDYFSDLAENGHRRASRMVPQLQGEYRRLWESTRVAERALIEAGQNPIQPSGAVHNPGQNPMQPSGAVHNPGQNPMQPSGAVHNGEQNPVRRLRLEDVLNPQTGWICTINVPSLFRTMKDLFSVLLPVIKEFFFYSLWF